MQKCFPGRIPSLWSDPGTSMPGVPGGVPRSWNASPERPTGVEGPGASFPGVPRSVPRPWNGTFFCKFLRLSPRRDWPGRGFQRMWGATPFSRKGPNTNFHFQTKIDERTHRVRNYLGTSGPGTGPHRSAFCLSSAPKTVLSKTILSLQNSRGVES